jgi:hypothetical protein
MPVDRAQAAHQLRRLERAAMVRKARREVGDLHTLALGIEQACAHDRGAGVVRLLGALEPFEVDAQLAVVAVR